MFLVGPDDLHNLAPVASRSDHYIHDSEVTTCYSNNLCPVHCPVPKHKMELKDTRDQLRLLTKILLVERKRDQRGKKIDSARIIQGLRLPEASDPDTNGPLHDINSTKCSLTGIKDYRKSHYQYRNASSPHWDMYLKCYASRMSHPITFHWRQYRNASSPHWDMYLKRYASRMSHPITFHWRQYRNASNPHWDIYLKRYASRMSHPITFHWRQYRNASSPHWDMYLKRYASRMSHPITFRWRQ
ncbi:hypothetical protein PoB_003338400 [Plakobranchus ocellatus]|uniref:Uncharacterized protein n=1 Tax=Plakobranchus ocellatus TaxID=259542 RepID=A0AAV4AKF9_9GAST|nr:hypothetical protein PoB_003338400 [Plakobranchus ocellatus]